MFVRDPCGIVCIIVTYMAVFYADYVVVRWIVLHTMQDRINNCVGERNQKYFIQFLVYVGALAIYAIILVITSWLYDCPQCNNDIAVKQNRILHCVILVLESALFGMFVVAILVDQFQAILGDETAVERVQGIQQRYHNKNTPRTFTLLSQVCGKSHPILWLLPCHNPPRYSFRKDAYLIDHEYIRLQYIRISDTPSDIQVTECLRNNNVNVSSVGSYLHLKSHKKEGIYTFQLPLKTRQYNIQNEVQNIRNNDRNGIFDISIQNDTISFNVSRDICVKEVLEHNCSTVSPPTFVNNKKNIIVEFSSPNIAKPFHVGHLRSTIIGNYVANINSFVKNNVKRINYLGDWGTQYGLIQLGINMADINEDEMRRNPIKALYTAYITANKLAETDSSILDRARKIFNDLENGTGVTYEQWIAFKQYTVEELTKVYGRIGITFDEYHWESMYNAKNIEKIITLMEKMQLLLRDEQNRKVVNLDNEKSVPIIKSDGSTLYIARDIAAAIDRFEKNNFDCMYYVVDNTQASHFSNLLEILKRLQMPWAERLKHVKFGRLHGMRTRKGNMVFLEDILDITRDIMKQKQIDSHTTKVRLDSSDKSSDILGISAMIVNDLKRKRQRDYTFDWNTAFDLKGDTGVKLQYTHCRLVSLERTCGAVLTLECEPSLLQEDIVDDLVVLIAKFEEVVLKSYEELEPCILTAYLFNLSNAINKAFSLLKVKDELPDLASQRLLLFHVARNVLAQGMKLLGLIPLEEM
ncbi:Uncharacterized protein DBV15_04367 [Temnothorax longispinosus]|uniref:Palmitoyltransferase n=1 Tax=Temnothorax longispinosus TaxID=300112 RepID=A0A4S2KFY7_9HYME|nr:Uncharacterized protein DBV15_04367 [Temnothorax longispinosus]